MISRRGFLKSGAVATVVSGPFFTGRVYAEGDADIGVAVGTDIDAAVKSAVAAVGGMGAFVKKGDRVAVKPNLSFASPVKRAATTNPEVLKSVMDLCLEAGAVVTDFRGAPFTLMRGQAVVANPILHPQLLDVIAPGRIPD